MRMAGRAMVMPRLFISHLIYDFAIDLATASRLFTLDQIGRHPLLADRTTPSKYASNYLARYSSSFIRTPWRIGEPHRWQLAKDVRKVREITDTVIPGDSPHAYHWLATGDLWLTLTLATTDIDRCRTTGEYNTPLLWITEPAESAGFDVFAVWERRAYLFEIQLTRLTAKRWREKWKRRTEWYDQQKWREAPWQRKEKPVKPRAVLVALTDQQDSTMQVPDFVIVARSMEEVPTLLRREKDK